MDLYQEILTQVLAQETMQITFPNLHIDAKEIVEMECYRALLNIKNILEDDSLDDAACFQKIEEIVCTFEDLGSSGGSRHDFG